MANLLEGVTDQYIDSNGKTRVLIYKFRKEQICVFISPIAPLDLPYSSKIPQPIKYETVSSFIKQFKFKIRAQTISPTSEKSVGVWLDSSDFPLGIYMAYVPFIETNPIENIEVSEESSLMAEEGESELNEYRNNKKIAEYLKKYVLFTYARDPESFDEESFVVIPKHKYDITKINKKVYFENNKVMYQNGKMIVTSEEMKKRLMSYLKVELQNNKPDVLSMSDPFPMTSHYQSISDFRSNDSQLIFMSKNGLMKWIGEGKKSRDDIVYSNILPDLKDPYFYRNPKIKNGQLCLIQNVKDDSLDYCLFVAYKWLTGDRVNAGYNVKGYEEPEKIISHNIFTTEGLEEKVKGETQEYVSVMKYDVDSYAAILFFR